jgi:hypothetical protein
LVDEDGSIHDWHDYAGKLVEAREYDRARKRADRAVRRTSTGHPPDIHRKSGVENPTVPDPTVPNQRGSENARGPDPWPAVADVRTECQLRGIPEAVGEAFWLHYEARGWLDGAGVAIAKWRPKLTTWAARDRGKDTAGKAPPNGEKPIGAAQSLMLAQEELKRVDARIRTIVGSYDEHQTKTEKDRAELKALRGRAAELKEKLGFKA